MNYNKSLVLVPAPQSYKKTSMRDVRIFSIIIIAQITGSQGTRQRSLPEHPTPGRIFRTCIPRWLRGERYQHFGARAYDPLSCIFMQTDPLAEKYYGFSPYAYCNGNPVNRVDPDGMRIFPKDFRSYAMISKTLPQKTRFLLFSNLDGSLNTSQLKKYAGQSGNIETLVTLSESDVDIEVTSSSFFRYSDGDGVWGSHKMSYYPFDEGRSIQKDLLGETINGLSTGESGFMGKTLFPNNSGLQNSTNESIQIIINDQLSLQGAAEVYSHEANGHAFIYNLVVIVKRPLIK